MSTGTDYLKAWLETARKASTPPWRVNLDFGGEDWPIADFGYGEEGGKAIQHVWLTTDQVRASQLRGDAISDARYIAQSSPANVEPLIECAMAMREAVRWMVNLGHDIGKAGGKPEPGEWEAAVLAGMDALALYDNLGKDKP